MTTVVNVMQRKLNDVAEGRSIDIIRTGIGLLGSLMHE